MELEDIEFTENEDKIIVKIYKYYKAEFSTEEVEDIGGNFEINNNELTFTKFDKKRSDRRVWRLYDQALKRLIYTVNNNKAVLLDHNKGIPLQGLNFIGIVDKGSEMIEVKPNTGCNANCTFCSVDEGIDSKKEVDFVVDEEYMTEELNELLEIKEDGNNIWINPHGEPTLYAPLTKLIKNIKQNKKVKDIMIITNGMLLNKTLANQLKEAGLTTISVSISGIQKAQEMMGTKGYNIEAVLKHIQYAKSIGLNIIVAPVYVKGKNEDQMKLVINKVPFANKISIQKFCKNKLGRNPIKEQDWESFFRELKLLQHETDTTLIEPLKKLKETNTYEQPFRKGDIVEVDIRSVSRFQRDKIGVAEERAIQVMRCNKKKGRRKFKILSANNNVFVAM